MYDVTKNGMEKSWPQTECNISDGQLCAIIHAQIQKRR